MIQVYLSYCTFDTDAVHWVWAEVVWCWAKDGQAGASGKEDGHLGTTIWSSPGTLIKNATFSLYQEKCDLFYSLKSSFLDLHNYVSSSTYFKGWLILNFLYSNLRMLFWALETSLRLWWCHRNTSSSSVWRSHPTSSNSSRDSTNVGTNLNKKLKVATQPLTRQWWSTTLSIWAWLVSHVTHMRANTAYSLSPLELPYGWQRATTETGTPYYIKLVHPLVYTCTHIQGFRVWLSNDVWIQFHTMTCMYIEVLADTECIHMHCDVCLCISSIQTSNFCGCMQ